LHWLVNQLATNLDAGTGYGAFYKDLFSSVASKNLSTKIVPPSHGAHQFNFPTFGSYSPTTDTAAFTANLRQATDPLAVIGHEVTHAALMKSVMEDPVVQSSMQGIANEAASSPAVNALSSADRYGVAELDKSGNPDVHEFMAEAAANRNFRNALKNTPSKADPSKSLWDQFREQSGHILGLSPTAMNSPMFETTLTGSYA
jgi:hypothetical protein